MNYKIWASFRKRPVKVFDEHYEAAGYLVAYIHCRGGAGVMLSDPESGKISYFAERVGLGKVNVEVFGSASDAVKRFDAWEVYQVSKRRA